MIKEKKIYSVLGYALLSLFAILMLVFYVTDTMGNPKVSDLAFPIYRDFLTPIIILALSTGSFLLFRRSNKDSL